MNEEQIIETLRQNRDVLAQFQVHSLSVFGSVARGNAKPDRDVDILVEFNPEASVGLFIFARVRRCLEEMLGRKVDLATPQTLHKALKQNILEEAVYAF